MPDFSLAQTPNFAGAALAGYQAGQTMGKQKLVQSALSGIDLTRPETITPLLKADPEHGIALLGASSTLLKNERDLAARQATTDYLTARFSAPSTTTGVSTNGSATSAASIVPTAQTPGAPSSAADAAWSNLAKFDPDGAVKLRESLDNMDEKQRAHLVESQTALHSLAAATQVLPYEQRKAYIQSHMPELASHFVTPEQISGFDPTDQNLLVVQQHALGVKGAIDQHNADRTAAETHRHNVADEGTAAAHVSLDRQKEARLTKWGPQSIIMGGAVPNNTDDLNY